MMVNKNNLDLATVKLGYSLADLSEKSGVAPGTLSRIRKGIQEPRPKTLYKIAKALEVPVESIIEQ